MNQELCWLSLRAMVAALRARDFSAPELLEAHLARIEDINGDVNAVVSLDADGARERAQAAERAFARGELRGPLQGVPVAVKDLEDTAELTTTYGSRIYRDHVPQEDGLMAERLRAAGANIIGKTNTSEFGAGSQTFNEVFGATRNPYDLTRTVGGSSGGAGAATASAMVPLADGSDLAASVRNPAGFCNVVGLRPSPGRWPDSVAGDAWDPLAVLGPIGRSVADVGYAFGALCGRDDRSPISLDPPSGLAEMDIPRSMAGLRVAWSENLGDLPVEPAVTEVLNRQRATFEELGCQVDDASPELAFADGAFDTLRALMFLGAHAAEVERYPELVKDTVVWNVEQGRGLTPSQIAEAYAARTRAYHAMRVFLERHDVLALPTSQVLPFPLEVEWPRDVAGQPMEHYVEWLRVCSRITVTAHPALSVPGGFTRSGLPVGLQLVGRYRGEVELLRIASAFEAATGFGARRPPEPH